MFERVFVVEWCSEMVSVSRNCANIGVTLCGFIIYHCTRWWVIGRLLKKTLRFNAAPWSSARDRILMRRRHRRRWNENDETAVMVCRLFETYKCRTRYIEKTMLNVSFMYLKLQWHIYEDKTEWKRLFGDEPGVACRCTSWGVCNVQWWFRLIIWR